MHARTSPGTEGRHAPRPLQVSARTQPKGTGHLAASVQDLVSRVRDADAELVHGVPFPQAGYRRQVLGRDPDAELIACTWASGQGTPLHGHGPSQTLTQVLEGHIVEERFVPEAAPGREGGLPRFRYELLELGPGSWSHAGPGVVHRVWGRTPTRTIQCTAPSNDNPLFPVDADLWPRLDEARAKALRGQ